MTVLTADRVLLDDGFVEDVWIEIVDGRIHEIGASQRDDVTDLGAGYLVPGFVDMHCHGGGSASFSEGEQAARTAAGFHRQHGTTSIVASLATDTLEELAKTCETLLDVYQEQVIAGIHLEGPFINPAHRGAHNPDLLLDPNPAWLSSVIESCRLPDGDNALRMVTLAAEMPRGLSAVATIREHGTVAALGHTNASYEETCEAIEAGIRVGTHLFNGMPSIRGRQPGPVIALLSDQRVTLELIADNIHVHPANIERIFAAAGSHRIALVSDCIQAAGMADGIYELAGSEISVTGGVARLTHGDSLAGSTLTMDRAVRNAVTAGVGLTDAIRAATATPAEVLSLRDRGRIDPGCRADLVHLSESLVVKRVMTAGLWVDQQEAA